MLPRSSSPPKPASSHSEDLPLLDLRQLLGSIPRKPKKILSKPKLVPEVVIMRKPQKRDQTFIAKPTSHKTNKTALPVKQARAAVVSTADRHEPPTTIRPTTPVDRKGKGRALPESPRSSDVDRPELPGSSLSPKRHQGRKRKRVSSLPTSPRGINADADAGPSQRRSRSKSRQTQSPPRRATRSSPVRSPSPEVWPGHSGLSEISFSVDADLRSRLFGRPFTLSPTSVPITERL
ncbi:hypothetical protein BC834DRAFT_967562 [Gloeopeniophorella convolvens]|nr:hypothetical protein BC834DRAFT_967562 [Gloeopeniophorella convolvens]